MLSIRFSSISGSVELFEVPGTPDGALFTGVSRLQLAILAGNDIVDLQVRSSVVPELAIDTGASNDEFTIKLSGDSNTTAFVQALGRLGAGGDTAIVDVANVGLTILRGGIDAGEGADTVEYITSSSLRGSPVLYGGLGNDTLKLTVNGSLQAGSSPRIIAGDGNDDVSMLVWGSLLGTPFSDGGAGFDYFQGVGTRVNFEEIN